MEDLTITPLSEFQAWLRCGQVLAAIKLKYDELFKAYDCFQKSNSAYIPNKHGGNAAASSYHHHRNDRFARPEKPPKDFAKQFTGYLNKLNNTNYDKIMSKTRIIIHQDNISQAIHTILSNCAQQSLYRQHLVRMIHDLVNTSGCNVQIKHAVQSYYDAFTQERKYIFQNYPLPPATEEDYNTFCAMQKHKTAVINLTNTWFFIWARYPDLLRNMAQDYIRPYLQLLQDDQCSGDPYHFNVFLSVVLACTENDPHLLNTQSQSIEWDAIKKNAFSISSKLKFMVEKIEQQIKP